MTDPTRGNPFNIGKALAPLRVPTPDLGTLALDIRTTSFLWWLDHGTKAGTWPTGSDFVRELLKERASRCDEGNASRELSALAAEQVRDLDEAALERTASAIVDVAKPHLTLLDSPVTRAPPGNDGPSDPPDYPAEAIKSTDALRNLSLNHLAAHRERSRELRALLIGERERLNRGFGLVNMAGLAGQHRAFSSLLGGVELGSLRELAQSPLARIAKDLAASGSIAQAAAASKLMRDVNRQLAGITQASVLSPWLKDNSVLALAQGARLDWVKGINQTLDLGIRGGIAEAIGKLAVDTKLDTGAAFAAAAMMRPGYQTVGTLALAGTVARGLAADVLGSYDLADADTGELFASAVSCVALLDDDEATTADRADSLHRFMDLFGSFTACVRNQVDKAGLITVLSLLVSIAGIYPGYRALLDHSAPKPTPGMVETNARLKALAVQMERDREPTASDRARIRYVHAPSALRVGPDRYAIRIRTVFPDQLVEVRDADGSWAKVAVFDYRSNQQAIGWMNRRNLHVRPE